jgi:hypothetical protein
MLDKIKAILVTNVRLVFAALAIDGTVIEGLPGMISRCRRLQCVVASKHE